ncbi:hypothetical protein H1S01_13635 [Heliobacterium chlorum]|uniref:Uncharacterized protein n=1 Tax=Heliobacterium chlorum TaxID=2698 RepID=A0ABR7T6A2_HELCL|nr:hypothetical protein [Heliobacterium chlorum]
MTVLNTPGTIAADYTGDIGVILIHLGGEPIEIKKAIVWPNWCSNQYSMMSSYR